MSVISGSLVAGFFLLGPGESPRETSAGRSQPQLARPETRFPASQPETGGRLELAAIRDENRDARFAMAEELDLIWAELANLSAADDETDNAPSPRRPPSPEKQTAQRPTQKWFDAASLLTAGVPQSDVERLRELYEAEQLDELYLLDVATREGWLSTPRYRTDLQRLKQDLRIELGEADYDRVIYASGKENRVEVDDVLQNSAAEAIGLRRGDIIVRYDGQLILSPQELRLATVRGSADQTTAIDVLRGTETLRLYVPRGPLGARIRRTRRPPE